MSTNTQMAEIAPTQADLVIDTNDFDVFSSLDDIVVEGGEPEVQAPAKENAKEEDATTEGVAEEDAELELTEDDEFADFDFDEIDDEHNDPGDSEEDSEDDEDEEDTEDESEEDDTDEEESEEDDGESDEEEVEYEGYLVTLPNGEEVSLADAVAGYRSAEALDSERKAFEEAKGEFEEKGQKIMDYLELAQLEADRVINDYDGFDWNALAREDPQKYVDNKEFLEKYTQRSREIKLAFKELRQKEEDQKDAEFKEAATNCIEVLKADIPGWNDELYNDLMDYAIENGAKEEDIMKTVDPMVFKLLHKAKQFDQGKQVVKAKVKKAVRSPKKVVKPQAKATIRKASASEIASKKFDAGEFDSVDVFNALLD
ncbi:hypothetical protein [Vibrio phage vB_VpaP_SJSY21]|nr:hypothetical protein [Vibrio phage vB_VpaP_SJSY21]